MSDDLYPSGPKAFVLSTTLPALAIAALLAVTSGLGPSAHWQPSPVALFAAIALGALVVNALTALLVGLPLTWLLARTGRESFWAYPLAGLLAGGAVALAASAILTPYDVRPILDKLAGTATLGALPGALSGALWWRLYRRHLQAGPETPA